MSLTADEIDYIDYKINYEINNMLPGIARLTLLYVMLGVVAVAGAVGFLAGWIVPSCCKDAPQNDDDPLTERPEIIGWFKLFWRRGVNPAIMAGGLAANLYFMYNMIAFNFSFFNGTASSGDVNIEHLIQASIPAWITMAVLLGLSFMYPILLESYKRARYDIGLAGCCSACRLDKWGETWGWSPYYAFLVYVALFIPWLWLYPIFMQFKVLVLQMFLYTPQTNELFNTNSNLCLVSVTLPLLAIQSLVFVAGEGSKIALVLVKAFTAVSLGTFLFRAARRVRRSLRRIPYVSAFFYEQAAFRGKERIVHEHVTDVRCNVVHMIAFTIGFSYFAAGVLIWFGADYKLVQATSDYGSGSEGLSGIYALAFGGGFGCAFIIQIMAVRWPHVLGPSSVEVDDHATSVVDAYITVETTLVAQPK